jgi:hypothetical protein
MRHSTLLHGTDDSQELMSVLRKILLEDQILVIDDFYPVEEIEQMLKQSSFSPTQDVNYAGLIATAPTNIQNIYQRIEAIVGNKLEFSKNDGQIRVLRAQDVGKEKTLVHFDPGKLNVLIYLTAPPPGVDPNLFGTHFYSHHQMHKRRFIPSDPRKDEIFKTFAIEDTFNLDAWEKWRTVDYKKNRLIIFDGHLFHSGPTQSFGEAVLDSRVTQLFFPTRPEIKP